MRAVTFTGPSLASDCRGAAVSAAASAKDVRPKVNTAIADVILIAAKDLVWSQRRSFGRLGSLRMTSVLERPRFIDASPAYGKTCGAARRSLRPCKYGLARAA